MARTKIKRVIGVHTVGEGCKTARVRQFIHYAAIMSGVTRGQRCNRERAGSQRFVGGPGQVGGVGSARERDNQRGNFREASEQKSFFLFGRQRVALGSMNLN